MLTREENDLLTQTGPGHARRRPPPPLLAAVAPSPRSCRPAARLCPSRCSARSWCSSATSRAGRACWACTAPTAAPTSATAAARTGGLRCLYHGWLYDVAGRCLEQPGEPAGSTFKDRVRQPAYPVPRGGSVHPRLPRARASRRCCPTTSSWALPASASLRDQDLARVQLPAGQRGEHRSRSTSPSCTASSTRPTGGGSACATRSPAATRRR